MKVEQLPGVGSLKKLIHSFYRNNFYPRILVNSIPKSGTHLLSEVIINMGFKHAGQINYAEIDGVPSRVLTMDEIEQKIHFLKKGRYLIGHKYFDEDFSKILKKNKISHLFIVRDPRDVAVSKAFYFPKRPEHELNSHFLGLNERERFIASINGVPGRMRSVAEIYNIFLPWLSENDCLTVKFEDLVGNQGGGNDEKQSETLRRIAVHLGIPFDESELKEIAFKSFNKNSGTFRKGQIGDWVNWLDDETLSLLKKDASIFKEYGYSI